MQKWGKPKMSEREILFRGKRLNNGEWVEGYFIRQYGSNEIITADDEIYHITPETVGQYTGLDKNGTRIFEGDIISCDYFIGVVSFYNGCWCASEMGKLPEDLYELINLKVIGNIYDNPELLKGD